jgi:DNA-binding NarL/FixJ family response regulator
MIEVAIVEDNPIIREGLEALINGTEGYCCLAAFSDCEALLAKLSTLAPDIILMDIVLPGMNGIEGVRHVKMKCPDVEVLMLTVYEDSDRIFEALCAGASGYLSKKTPPARLLEALREVYEGGSPMSSQIARKVVHLFRQKTMRRNVHSGDVALTGREREILQGLADGNTYQAIALNLHVSIDTVRFHIRNIYRKLHAHSESEAVAKALKSGYL